MVPPDIEIELAKDWLFGLGWIAAVLITMSVIILWGEWREYQRKRTPVSPDILLPDGWRRWHIVGDEALLYEWRKGKWCRIRGKAITLAELEDSE